MLSIENAFTEGELADFGQRVVRIIGDREIEWLAEYKIDGVALDASLMQDDGIHPTTAAQPTILANVWPSLAPLLKHSGLDVAAQSQQ